MKVNGIALQEGIFTKINSCSEETAAAKGNAGVMTEKTQAAKNGRAVIRTNVEKSSSQAGIYEADAKKENEIEEAILGVKEQLTELANRMTGLDYESMKVNGYSPKKDELGRIETVVDQIRAKLAAFCDDYETFGYVDQKDLEAIMGNTALASAVAGKLSDYNLPVTDDNIKEALDGVQMASSLTEVTREQAGYLIANKLEPTIENIYKAQHSTKSYHKQQNPLTDQQWAKIEPQAADILKQAGVEAEEEHLQDARWMIEQGIPFGVDTVTDMYSYRNMQVSQEQEELVSQVVQAMAFEKQAAKAKPDDTVLTAETVTEAVEEVQVRIQEALGTDSGQEAGEQKEDRDTESKRQAETVSISELTARRRLEELRLMMTKEAGLNLMRKGIDIRTEPLENLIEELRRQEQEYYQSLYQVEGFEWSEQKQDLLHETQIKTQELQAMPSYLVGKMMQGTAVQFQYISIEETWQQGRELGARLQAAGESYEALMTRPDKEYGDSIYKAFRNIDDILTDIDMEPNDENRRSVRILAYNQMEITKESISQVKELDGEYQYFLKNLTPRAAMHMIERNINPLQTEIHELNDRIEQIKEEIGPSKEERYSEFLWKLEKTQGISEEERTAYIGLYRLINTIDRTQGAAIGALVKQGAEVTLDHLLTAARSRKARNMDISIDKAFGMTEAVWKEQSITEQLKLFYDSPDTASQNSGSYGKEMQRQLKEMSESTEAIRVLVESSHPVTLDSLLAAGMLAGHKEGGMKRFWERWQGYTDTEEITEALSADTKMEALYADAEKGFAERLEVMMQQDTAGYETLEEARIFSHAAKLMTHMARQENYQIPMELQGESTLVHVKLVRGSAEAGKVSAEMEIPGKGKVMAEFWLRSEFVGGYILGDSMKLKEELEELRTVITDALEAEGLSVKELTFGNSREIPRISYGQEAAKEQGERMPAQTASLYSIAKVFLGAVKGMGMAE